MVHYQGAGACRLDALPLWPMFVGPEHRTGHGASVRALQLRAPTISDANTALVDHCIVARLSQMPLPLQPPK